MFLNVFSRTSFGDEEDEKKNGMSAPWPKLNIQNLCLQLSRTKGFLKKVSCPQLTMHHASLGDAQPATNVLWGYSTPPPVAKEEKNPNILYLCRGGSRIQSSESHIPQKSGGAWMWTSVTCYRDRLKQQWFGCESKSKFPQFFGCHLSGSRYSISNSTKETETKNNKVKGAFKIPWGEKLPWK